MAALDNGTRLATPTTYVWIVMFYDYEQTCFGEAFDNEAAAKAYAGDSGTVERQAVWHGPVPRWEDWSGWVHVMPDGAISEYRIVKNLHVGEYSQTPLTKPSDYFYRGTGYAFEVSGPTKESVQDAIAAELKNRGCLEWQTAPVTVEDI